MAFYLSQSERMQRILRATDFGGPISLSLALVAVVVFFIAFTLIKRFSLEDLFSPFMLVRIVAGWLVLWISFTFVWSTVLSRDRPYGLKRFELFILMLSGLLRPDIQEYDPNEKMIPSEPYRR
jgi:hypothetical protein